MISPLPLFTRVALAAAIVLLVTFTPGARAQRQMEDLGRGLIALRQEDGSVFLSWRLLGTEPTDLAFDIQRITADAAPVRLNTEPLTAGTFFRDAQADPAQSHRYTVSPVAGRPGLAPQEPGVSLRAGEPARPYLSMRLETPDGYTPNDASVGDLDGDGEYDLVIHQVGTGRDNSQRGTTTEPILEGYTLGGKLLWRINLGKNIREGAHYTQFLVYDFDGDGRAEVVCKTADGTVDGKGVVIGDAAADHRNQNGHVLRGPEFLTVFDGRTGAALATTAYIPGRHPTKTDPTPEELRDVWGDGNGNRSDRYLACVAYLDGERPSIVMCRGYYTRSVLAAWNWRDGKLSHVWTFDSDAGPEANRAYRGQGDHNLSIGDVDNDGRDEIVYGSAVIDDNGQGLYSTGWGHGDAMHVTDHDPSNPGLEVFNIQERFDKQGMNMRDAKTGRPIFLVPSTQAATEGGDKGEGPGRGNAFNIDPRYPGSESWAAGAGMSGIYNLKGERIAERPSARDGTDGLPCNFAVWWDGDLQRELLDRNLILKWNWQTQKVDRLLTATDCVSDNGTKATPVLSADLFGDWREEVIWRTNDPRELRIYTTTIPTSHRFRTLMHDPHYRLSIVWQNVAYNQPPHTSFYIGEDMTPPPAPKITVVPRATLR